MKVRKRHLVVFLATYLCGTYSSSTRFLLAQTYKRAKGDDKAFMEALWTGADPGSDIDRIRRLAHQTSSDEKCMLLLETYKETAVRALADLENATLKGLLRRVLGKAPNNAFLPLVQTPYATKY